MKKLISCILVLVLAVAFAAPACADFDLSGLSYDELVALRDQINLAIWNSEEWQEVTVPQGVWEVGADIPEGKWTIRALPGGQTWPRWGKELKDGGVSVKTLEYCLIYSPTNRFYEEGKDVTEWTIELSAGEYLEIGSGSAVFTPFAGKPSLGFK